MRVMQSQSTVVVLRRHLPTITRFTESGNIKICATDVSFTVAIWECYLYIRQSCYQTPMINPNDCDRMISKNKF